jgi:RNA polymerase sigma-70 factor (ECF subfamily)
MDGEACRQGKDVDVERALVAAATAGDRQAFDELVRLYRVHVVSVARALLGGAPEAEDVAQEAFVRAWRSLNSFRGDCSFRGWLHRIVVNCVITHHRRQSRWRRLFARGRHQADDPTLVPTAGNSQEAMVLRLAIDRALMQIPFQLRVALVLRDVQGLDYKEIAEVLRIPMGTVESRIFRGRQKMRALLAPLPERAQ